MYEIVKVKVEKIFCSDRNSMVRNLTADGIEFSNFLDNGRPQSAHFVTINGNSIGYIDDNGDEITPWLCSFRIGGKGFRKGTSASHLYNFLNENGYRNGEPLLLF